MVKAYKEKVKARKVAWFSIWLKRLYDEFMGLIVYDLKSLQKKLLIKGLKIITSHTPIVNLVWVGKW